MKVHTTKDYGIFKILGGNRSLNLPHLNKLKRAMREFYLFTIITVNEKHEIIDGQHRFEAIKSLNLPLYYVICPGYGLEQALSTNLISRTWTADDYLSSYCDSGNPEYLKYREFKDKYKFHHAECIAMLGQYRGASGNTIKMFHNGEFKIKDYRESCDIADKLTEIGQFYSGYKRRSFVFTMLRLFKLESFCFDEFLHKLKIQPGVMVDCSDKDQYASLVEDVYNYRRRIKVNLRYPE